MIIEIIKSGKIKDFLPFKESAATVSFIVSLLIIGLCFHINLFENFNMFKVPIQNISINIASGLLAMMGIILTGIALILGLLDKKFRNIINDISEKKNSVRQIMLSFKFITLNIGLGSILFFILYLLLFSRYNITKNVFYITIFFVIYYFLFIIFYTISLISNSIELFLIKDMYENIDYSKKNFYNIIDEIRIDYIMSKIVDENNIKSYENLIRELNCVVDSSEGISDDVKKDIKAYFEKYYS